MTQLISKKFQLFYVYDPMCSWCWGYRPTWQALQQALGESIPTLHIESLVGGLAVDSDVEMPDEMQQFLINTWHKISDQLGTTFNFDFWQQCSPRRSTYPACRACLVAREFGLEQEMNHAIQAAYYLKAQNPSDDDTLIALAASLQMDTTNFSKQLNSPLIATQLSNEIQRARALPIQGFPSLVLSIDGVHYPIPLDY